MLCLEKMVGLLLKTPRKSDAYKKGPWKSQRYTVTGSRYSEEGSVLGVMFWAFPSALAILEGLRYFSFRVFRNMRKRELLCMSMAGSILPYSVLLFLFFM